METNLKNAEEEGVNSPVFIKKKPPKPLIAAVVALLVVGVALISVFAFFSNSADKPQATDSEESTSQESVSQPSAPPVSAIGDRVTFGTWRGNPLTWRVLDIKDGQALMITEDSLCVLQYDDLSAYGGASNIADWSAVSVTWADSSLRTWLNGAFLATAFSQSENAAISLTNVTNPDNADYHTSGGPDTQDKAFLLSIDEAKRYFTSDSDRVAYITMTEDDVRYTLEMGRRDWGYDEAQITSIENGLRSENLDQRKTENWWLRSPGYVGGGAAFVLTDNGVILSSGLGVYFSFAVRPALWVAIG